MIHFQRLSCTLALFIFGFLPLTLTHGNDHGGAEASIASAKEIHLNSSANIIMPPTQSYYAHPEFGGIMLAHIAIMVIAWFFILPIGVVLSVARSRLALIAQMIFLGVHSIGLLLGSVYASKTPDLYPNNFHSKIGWIVTLIVLAQCIIGLAKIVCSKGDLEERWAAHTAFLSLSSEALAQHQQIQPYRYSNDSGHFTASETSRTPSISSTLERDEQQKKLLEYENARADADAEKQGFLGNSYVQRFASSISIKLSKRIVRLLDVINGTIDCVSLVLGFTAIVSGAVVYGGVFRGDSIFNGLAHSVKGGIFFWYGLLTLGRWMGCFAEIGWAWNVKPPIGIVSSRKARIPSAEFVESFVIFLYGISNVWIEHLAAWGSAWSPQDYEHVSISIMFFGGGLCGMLVESRRIREFLNSVILTSPAACEPTGNKGLFTSPKSYQTSMNPFPGFIILLLGLMMSSHHQSSMVSTMVHKQWGTLLVGFALARAVTYILLYLSPPSSYLPSRPPSELISAFCLISGGLIFMASNKDTVAAMEDRGIHAMFPFTVTMGFTAFLMAWAIIVLAVKGWAITRQRGLDLEPTNAL